MKPKSSQSLPAHIAIIMDGNGRWARRRGLSRLEGHRAGAEAVRRTVTACAELGVSFLTLYAFSAENWKRPQTEVAGLMRYLRQYLKNEMPVLQKNNVRLLSIGRRDRLPAATRKTLEWAKRETEQNTGLVLVLAIDYGSRNEIFDAAVRLYEEIVSGRVDADRLDPESLSRYLYTFGIPDPDLLIRTSGELRLSNFLLWQVSYAELYFPEVLWPDFDRSHLEEAIREYGRRDRRFGGVKQC